MIVLLIYAATWAALFALLLPLTVAACVWEGCARLQRRARR